MIGIAIDTRGRLITVARTDIINNPYVMVIDV